MRVDADAPGFELKNQDDQMVSLDDFKDEIVVVYFYPRADTPGCTTEACGFRDAWDGFTEKTVSVLGISDDPVEDVKKFHDKYELPFDLLSDETGEVASLYDSYGEKQMFGNTFDGVFRNTFVIGRDGKIKRVFDDVSPEGHADEILEAIDELDASS